VPSDYFELLLTTLNLTPEERELVIERRKKMCICEICPNYRQCAGEEGEERAFCTLGGSACIDVEGECLCATCPLSREMDLRYSFYCTRGSENQQRIRDIIGIR
jgi:hypothetical protein